MLQNPSLCLFFNARGHTLQWTLSHIFLLLMVTHASWSLLLHSLLYVSVSRRPIHHCTSPDRRLDFPSRISDSIFHVIRPSFIGPYYRHQLHVHYRTAPPCHVSLLKPHPSLSPGELLWSFIISVYFMWDMLDFLHQRGHSLFPDF